MGGSTKSTRQLERRRVGWTSFSLTHSSDGPRARYVLEPQLSLSDHSLISLLLILPLTGTPTG